MPGFFILLIVSLLSLPKNFFKNFFAERLRGSVCACTFVQSFTKQARRGAEMRNAENMTIQEIHESLKKAGVNIPSAPPVGDWKFVAGTIRTSTSETQTSWPRWTDCRVVSGVVYATAKDGVITPTFLKVGSYWFEFMPENLRCEEAKIFRAYERGSILDRCTVKDMLG